MPLKFNWTHAQDTRIRRLRGEGATWDAIAASLDLSRGTVIERGRRIGARLPPPEPWPPAGRASQNLGFDERRNRSGGRALSAAG